MNVWVDTQSGTWGDVRTLRILLLDMNEEQFGEELDDNDRISYAEAHGVMIEEGQK